MCIRNLFSQVFFLSAFVLCAVPSIAQDIGYGDPVQRACPGDSTRTVTQPDNWLLYCTLGDSLTGDIDSSVCIELDRDGFRFDGVAPRRPIFMEYIGDTITLEENTHYQVEYGTIAAFTAGQRDSFRMTSVISLYYDETGVTRTGTIEYGTSGSFASGGGTTCLVTENMDDAQLTSLVLVSDAFSLGSEPIRFSYSFERPFTLIDVTTARAPNFPAEVRRVTGSTIQAELTGFDLRLMLYDRPGVVVPSVNEPDTGYLEFSSRLQRDKRLVVTLPEQAYLTPQPFVEILARDVSPDEPLPFTLEYESDLCIPFTTVERPISAGNGIRFAGGQPHFGGANACIQLRSAAKMELAAGHRVWYGTGGQGMLAVNPGASLLVEEDADFLFDGTLMINRHGEGEYRVTIAQGGSFEFSEAARIVGGSGVLPQGQIKVLLLGGSFDMSALTAHEQGYFEVIVQPNVSRQDQDWIGSYLNPADGELSLYSLTGEEHQVEAVLLDALGRTLTTHTLTVQPELAATINTNWPQVTGLKVLAVRDAEGRTQTIRVQ